MTLSEDHEKNQCVLHRNGHKCYGCEGPGRFPPTPDTRDGGIAGSEVSLCAGALLGELSV